eukprot:s5745_g2.t1
MHILTCAQPCPTVVNLQGSTYRLAYMLPEQRDGSAVWFNTFSAYLVAEGGVTLWPGCEALFAMRDHSGGGEHGELQKLAQIVESKYKCTLEWLVSVYRSCIGILMYVSADALCSEGENIQKELPAEGVKAARAEELGVIRQMGVWEVIPVLLEKRQRGPAQPEDQSTWSDFFAAMPPLSSLQALFTLATTKQVPNDRGKLTPVDSGGEVCIMFLDVKKAHFWSPVRRRLLVELPPEAGEGRDKVGLLKRSLYGTRDAPSNWERAIKDALEKLGSIHVCTSTKNEL